MKRISILLACFISATLASSAVAQPAAGAQGGGSGAMGELIKTVKAEPTIKEVQAAALRFYKLEPSRILGLAKNAQLKGLVPDITVNFTNSVGNNFQNTKDGLFPVLPGTADNPNPNNYKERQETTNDEISWNITGRWDLSRLVFSSEALDAKSLITLEENLIREVTTLYFSRRRMLAGIFLSEGGSDEDMFYTLTRLDEMTATLDAFTGGMFAKRAWDWEKALLGGK